MEAKEARVDRGAREDREVREAREVTTADCLRLRGDLPPY